MRIPNGAVKEGIRLKSPVYDKILFLTSVSISAFVTEVIILLNIMELLMVESPVASMVTVLFSQIKRLGLLLSFAAVLL